MPKPLPPAEKRFKPGQSGNPGGRPKLSKEEKMLRQCSDAMVQEIFDLVLTNRLDALKALASDESQVSLKVGLARAALKAISKGDYATLDKMLTRRLGAPKQHVEHSGEAFQPITHVAWVNLIEDYEKKKGGE